MEKIETISRKDALIRAAKAKAAITAWFNNNGNVSATQSELAKNKELQELECVGIVLSSLLLRMVDSSLLIINKESSPHTYTLGTKKYKERKLKRPPVKRSKHELLPIIDRSNNIKVDIVKATGNVRITLNSCTIEIGFV